MSDEKTHSDHPQDAHGADAAIKALKALQAEIQETVLDTVGAVDAYRIRFLSRKQGQITELLKRIPEVANEHKKKFGQEINAAKALVESRIEAAAATFAESETAKQGPEGDGAEQALQGLDEVVEFIDEVGLEREALRTRIDHAEIG